MMKEKRLQQLLLGGRLSELEDRDLRSTHEAMKRVSDLAGAMIRIAALSFLAGLIFRELQTFTESWIDLSFAPLFLIVLVTLCALTLRFFLYLMAVIVSIFFSKSFDEVLEVVFVSPEIDTENNLVIPDNFPGFFGKVKLGIGVVVFVILFVSVAIAIGGIVFGLDSFTR
jgi:hypothetical protein